MSAGWSIGDAATFWASQHATSILQYPVSPRREQQLADRRRERVETIQDQEDTFLRVHRLQHSQEESIIKTSEAEDLEFWAKYQSWTFCATCGKLDPRKLLPPFRKRTASPLFTSCKCSKGTYEVPTTDDVPLILRRLTVEDQRVLSPFQVHCGDYRRMFNGYRQRTGPFRVSWCSNPVRDQIDQIVDEDRRDMILEAYYYLLNSPQSSYSQFIRMQLCGERRPFLYEIYSSPRYRGVECALWPALYFRTSLCESVLEGQNNRASGKISYMHKVLSPVVDFAITYDILQYQYDRWLFKTITGGVNASKASGCSPNRSLENKSFSKTFWQHQHLFLIDAVHQYGFPSLFITISPYEWTFPFPPFIEDIRNTYGKDTTEVAVLETLHIAHVLEQLVRGYLTGGNSNRWRTHVLSNVHDAASKNVRTFFYRFEFQQRGTLHLHMLVWLEDVSTIRAEVMHAPVPWDNAHDAFLVANAQKSHQSCLLVNNAPDAFITDANGNTTLQFQYTEDDAKRNIRGYITTLLGSLKCRTDVQLADGKAMLLKYVSSYVAKMHESATSEGLYCKDVTGYQAAHSFLRRVRPLEPEMVFQLSNIKVCWTDKMTILFCPPFPEQTSTHKVYNMYLECPRGEDDQSLLQWLRCHQTSSSKAKAYATDRVLVGVKYLSVFNPIFFYQHLTMHHPHRRVEDLHHPQATTMPSTIAYFAQSAVLTPECCNTSDAITAFFENEGHKDYFINTIVSYVHSLYDILHLWQIGVVTADITNPSSISVERLYPLSPHQNAIFTDIAAALSTRQSTLDHHQSATHTTATWEKFRVLLGKPGTGKSQVLIRAINHAIRCEMSVLVAAPVALLAQGYNAIFLDDIDTDTLHSAFNIPIHGPHPNEINYALNKYDLVVVDEASMISSAIFETMASTFNRMNTRPVVVLAGDKCQQQPLQTIDGRTSSTTSIINDHTFSSTNAVTHTLYQQFRIIDPEYAKFLDFIRFMLPTQQEVDDMQTGIVLCPEGELSDEDIWHAYQQHSDATIMTVSRKAAQRINEIIVRHPFPGRPLNTIPCVSAVESNPIFPQKHMEVIFTENRDKAARIVNGQQATILGCENNTIILCLPEGQRVFVYPVTHIENDTHHKVSILAGIRTNNHKVTREKHTSSHHLVRLRHSPSWNRVRWPFASTNKIKYFPATTNPCTPAEPCPTLKCLPLSILYQYSLFSTLYPLPTPVIATITIPDIRQCSLSFFHANINNTNLLMKLLRRRTRAEVTNPWGVP